MGLIKVCPEQASHSSESMHTKIPRIRLNPKEKADVLRAGDIPIKPCGDPKKFGINKVKFTPLKKLMDQVSDTPPTINCDDVVWAAGWIVKESEEDFSHANWNGWMKNIHSNKSETINQY